MTSAIGAVIGAVVGAAVTYAYDAWDKLLSVADFDGNPITDPTPVAHVNPIRFQVIL